MALLGTGVVAIWNGIDPEAVDDFVEWHIREHIPERVGLPGWLRGRRYVAVEAEPAFFNFCETDTPAALTSPVYLARLNDPTPWTRKVVAHFRDTSRTVCEVVSSLGGGEGGSSKPSVSTWPTVRPPAQARMRCGPSRRHPASWPFTYCAGGRRKAALAAPRRRSARSRTRWSTRILLIEAVGAGALRTAGAGTASTAALERHGVASGCRRGIYRLQVRAHASGRVNRARR